MKKRLKMFAVLAASLTVLSAASAFGGISASALNYSYVSQGNVTYMVYDTYAIARKCNAAAVNVTIPETVSGKPVTTISAEAFKNCANLKKVKLPQNLKKINNSAFRNCTSLSEITIPYQVTAVGGYAFAGCTQLKGIIVDNPDMVMPESAAMNVGKNVKSQGLSIIYWNCYGKVGRKHLPTTIGNGLICPFRFGDVNEDCEYDIVDAQMILNMYSEYLNGSSDGGYLISGFNRASADLSRDGSIGPEDASIASEYYVETMCGNDVGSPMAFAHNFMR